MSKVRYGVFFTILAFTLHCGYSGIYLAESAAGRNSWACFQGTNGVTKFIVLGGIFGVAFDLLIGYLITLGLKKAGEKTASFAPAFFMFYGGTTLLASMLILGIFAAPFECPYDFKSFGFKVKKFGRYFEIANRQDDRTIFILDACQRLNGRPASKTEAISIAADENSLDINEILLIYEKEKAQFTEYAPHEVLIGPKLEKHPVTFCIIT